MKLFININEVQTLRNRGVIPPLLKMELPDFGGVRCLLPHILQTEKRNRNPTDRPKTHPHVRKLIVLVHHVSTRISK